MFDLFDLIDGRRFLAPDAVGATGGHPVANTGNYTNAYTGSAESFDSNNTMEPQIKQWYNTQALENARNNHIFAQFAENVPLPEHHGMTIEKRIVIDLQGSGMLEVTGMNRESAIDLLSEQLMPMLKQALADEIYEGGDDVYEF